MQAAMTGKRVSDSIDLLPRPAWIAPRMSARLLRPIILAWLTLALATIANARELKIIFSQYTPPYVFENGEGIVVEIVRAALEPAGYRVLPVYVPIGRGFELFADKRVDGTAIIRQNSGLKANYSHVFMRYHNHAIALKARNLAVRGLDDLKGRTIIAFQNAHKYLGEEFGRAVADNPNYKEMANQETQTPDAAARPHRPGGDG